MLMLISCLETQIVRIVFSLNDSSGRKHRAYYIAPLVRADAKVEPAGPIAAARRWHIHSGGRAADRAPVRAAHPAGGRTNGTPRNGRTDGQTNTANGRRVPKSGTYTTTTNRTREGMT